MLPALLLTVAVQFGNELILDPTDHVSPSGEYVMHIDPDARPGLGAARYELSRAGEPQWSAELPFSLRRAAVTDEGFVVGHAIQNSGAPYGYLIVAILDPTGKVLLEEKTERTGSRHPHGSPGPNPRGLMVDGPGDRCVVRIPGEEDEHWWRYAITRGERVAELQPSGGLGLEDRRQRRIREVWALPESDLYLIHYDLGIFALIDGTGQGVWRLDERGSLLEVGPEGTFELGLEEQNERVRYRAQQVADAPGTWRVKELDRGPHQATDPEAIESDSLPAIELTDLGTVDLKSGEATKRPLLDEIRAWRCDREGEFVAIRRLGGGRYSHVRLGPGGRLLEERELAPLPEELARGRVRWHSMGGDVWLAIVRVGNPEQRAVYRASGGTGELVPLPGFVLPTLDGAEFDIDEVAAFEEGGFVALGKHSFKYTRTVALYAFDEEGAQRWVELGRGSPLFSPQDVTVTAAGQVVVLENIRKQLQIFDGHGNHLSDIELEEAWGQEPNYLSQVEPGPGGGVLVHDFRGEPTQWHMNLEGQLHAQFTPRFPDGRAPEALARKACFASDGTLWTSDGYSLLRLDEDGVVVESLGQQPTGRNLQDPGPAAILPDGRICVQDKRTGALFAWSETGELVLVGEVQPEDADRVNIIGRIVAEPNGTIWAETKDRDLRRGSPHLGWRPDGERISLRSFGGDVAFPPEGDHHWTWGFQTGLTRRSATGEPLGKVDRRPDRSWIRSVRDVCFGPAGEILVLDKPKWASAPPWLLRYQGDGEPLDVVGSSSKLTSALFLSAAGDWALLSDYRSVVLLVNLAEGGAWTFEVPTGAESASGLSPDGRRLLSLDRSTMKLHRFALP